MGGGKKMWPRAAACNNKGGGLGGLRGWFEALPEQTETLSGRHGQGRAGRLTETSA